MEKNNEIIKRDYLSEILEVLSSDKTKTEKQEILLQYHESDIADVLGELSDDKKQELYEILDTNVLGEVILYSDDIEKIVQTIEPEKLADIIESMDADDAIDVLEELDKDAREEVVNLIEDEEIVEDIITLSKYDGNVIGSEMTNNFITIQKNDSVKSAMRKVISQAKDNDNVTTIFVLDDVFRWC